MERGEERAGRSRELAQRLRAAINAGELEPGVKLPSYRELAQEHGMAINTAREAVRLLEQQGHAVVQHGRGAFVAEPAEGSPEDRLRALRGELEDVRSQLRQTGSALADVEGRLSEVVDRIGRNS